MVNPNADTFRKERTIKISGKEVEEVGFEKIRQQLAHLNELRIVLLDGMCIARPLPESTIGRWSSEHPEEIPVTDVKDVCPRIIELDLSRNLFEDWREVLSLCEQLTFLKTLRVE